MSSTPPVRDPKDPSINPAMQAQIDKSHGTEFSGTDPMDTVSVKNPNEGRSWPLIWAVVVVASILVMIYTVVT